MYLATYLKIFMLISHNIYSIPKITKYLEILRTEYLANFYDPL